MVKKNKPSKLGDILKNVNKKTIKDAAEKERQNSYDIRRIFQQMELDLISSMHKAFYFHKREEAKEGFSWEQWQLSKLRAIEEYRKRNRGIVDSYSKPIQKAIDEQLKGNFRKGENRFVSFTKRLLERVKRFFGIKEDIKLDAELGLPNDIAQRQMTVSYIDKVLGRERKPPADNDFFGVNEKKLEALQKVVEQDLQKAQYSVLRKMDDVYRQTIYKSQVYMQSGVKSLDNAIDMATKDFLGKGINSITYKDGKQVNIASYAEMCLRTASQRATFLGEAKKRDEWGIYLVVVSAHANTCKMCMPWQGKVLIDDVFSHPSKEFMEANEQYALLSEAIKSGLLHPNCRHSLITYFPGITQIPTIPDGEKAVNLYEIEQEQRSLERQLRKWKRVAVGSVNDENKFIATNNVNKLSIKLKELIKENSSLRRNYKREEVEGYKPTKISGALNPESKAAERHAVQYYESVRKMKTDINKIAHNIGFSEKMITKVKEHIFYKEHNLGYGISGRFDPDYDMARSWQRLIEGKEIKDMDIIMIKHEYLEAGLMKRYNYEYRIAHDITEKKYNYSKAVKEDRGGQK